MIVPTPIPYNQIPVGGVFTNDGINWLMVVTATTYIDLHTAAISTVGNTSQPYTYFPNASLAL